ncbi:MAG TPA: ABC transporter ATP-binding protein [Burkholderiales bacterium]|jgi:branched-chain amino acid transport system permease protein|nr:ABC transporter ATP-binding protein [Burkholderiales bacterium]
MRLPASQAGKLAMFAALALLLTVLPFGTEALLGRSWVRVIDGALLFSMLAIGLNVVVGYAGLLDLGFIAFFGIGAYSYSLLASPQFGLHYPFWALLPLGAVVAGLFGVILGAPTLRLRGDYLAIVTLGFGEIIRIFLVNLNRPFNLTNGPQGITLIDPIRIGGFDLSKTYEVFGMKVAAVHSYYFLFLLCVIASIILSQRLENSRIGRAWIAIREDEIAAKAMGINTRDIKLLAFAMGATFGGVSGGLFAAFQGFVSPESFKLMDSIMILCMVVLGGMGHVPGVVLGAILLTALPEGLRYVQPLQQNLFGRVYVDPADLRMLLFGLALVLMMRFRPQGLWPSKRREHELKGET